MRWNLLVANLDSCWLLPKPKNSLHKCYEQNQQQRAALPAKLLAKGLGPRSCGAPTGSHEGHGQIPRFHRLGELPSTLKHPVEAVELFQHFHLPNWHGVTLPGAPSWSRGLGSHLVARTLPGSAPNSDLGPPSSRVPNLWPKRCLSAHQNLLIVFSHCVYLFYLQFWIIDNLIFTI